MSRPTVSVYTGEEAWDAIWKWTWFQKDLWRRSFRKQKEGTRCALESLLQELGVESVLDCSCGLGWKTIILAEMGCEVEGSDGSAVAVRHARQLAREEGLKLRFFHSSWEELGEKAKRSYDCVFSDAFAWITTRRSLEASARGIASVLRAGGAFIFQGAHQWSKNADKGKLIEEQWNSEPQFQLLPPCRRKDVRLTTLVVREKTRDGVRGHRVHIIDERGKQRVEVASVLDLCRWTWRDYKTVLRRAGFDKLYSVREKNAKGKPQIFNVAEK